MMVIVMVIVMHLIHDIYDDCGGGGDSDGD